MDHADKSSREALQRRPAADPAGKETVVALAADRPSVTSVPKSPSARMARSPRVAAQRQTIEGIFGPAIQRREDRDRAAPVQGRWVAVQRTAADDGPGLVHGAGASGFKGAEAGPGALATQRLAQTGARPVPQVSSRAVPAGPAVPVLQGVWDIDKVGSTVLEEMLELVGLEPGIKGKARTRARARLKVLADATSGAEQLRRLIRQLGGYEAVKGLLETSSGDDLESLLNRFGKDFDVGGLVKRVGGAANLGKYYEGLGAEPAQLTELLKLDTDLTELTRMRAKVKDAATLILVLKACPPVSEGRAKFTADTVDKADGMTNLNALRKFGDDISVMRGLLDQVPVVSLLALAARNSGAAVQGRGRDVLALLSYTDFAKAEQVIGANSGASLDTWKVKATHTQLMAGPAGAKVHPKAIRFTQETVSNGGAGYTVKDNVAKLKREPAWDIPSDAIRAFRMNAGLRPKIRSDDTDFGYAGADNLEDGQVYTLDNRRLYAYQQAGRDSMPAPQFVALNVVQKEWWKMTTTNGGKSAQLV